MKLAFCELRPTVRGGVNVGAFFSTEALSTPTPEPALPAGWKDNLYNRVMIAGEPSRTMVPVLERWIEEGKTVEKRYLQGIIKQMKTSRRYHHGLEISMWMSNRRYFYLTPGDHADRLDLIHRVHGREHAENYFNSIPTQQKLYQPYGALLTCYAREQCVQKVEAVFQTMKELNMLTSHSYNVLMKLYCDIGQLGKVEAIFQQLKKDGFVPNVISHGILMEAYAQDANIDGIESLLRSIPKFKGSVSWHTYAVAAKAYVKAGLINEALPLLLKAEELIPWKKTQVAYGFFLSVYAEIGNKPEMYRIWNSHKSRERMSNTVYMSMISGLLKLDDIEGAENMLKEWESEFVFYDFRVPNILLTAYCNRGLVEKAESLINKAIENGSKPYANTWDRFARMYFMQSQSLKAVDMMKRALLVGQSPWKPSPENVNAALECLKEQKDVDEAEAFVELLQRHITLTREHYNYLMKTYVSAGRSVTDLLNRMKVDGFDADEETQEYER